MNAIFKAHSSAWLDSKIYRLAWLVGPLALAMFVFGSKFWITAGNNLHLLPVPMSYTEDEKKTIDADLKANEAAALQALRAAAEDGDSRALNQLGLLHDPTAGRLNSVPPSIDVALAYYERAAALGNVNGLLNAGYMLNSSGKADEACRYFPKAAKADPKNIEAMMEAGYCTATEKDAEATAKAKAIEQMESAGASGFARAYLLLGTTYLIQSPPDFKQAISHYEKAVAGNVNDHGFSHAQMGSIYFRGEPGVPQDFRQAISHFQKGYEQGSGLCALELSFIYSKGTYGAPIDHRKYFEYAGYAAKAGEPAGHNNLAVAYMYGQGTSRDYRLAAKHYLIAISLGNRHALDSLKTGSYPSDFIMEVQSRLSKAVMYNGPINGKGEPALLRSLEALLDSKRSFE
ncbi:tetratricopeptide repeat protein [Hydrogenophaga sp. MI9]|uniref:tetratricopeptide repeat protein n=1 Tax=Hydrogenophaga sp. MI9 TaxID=3453719 RepID=UPI003EEC224B